MISSQNKNFQEAPASRPGREAHVTVAPYVKEAELSVQRVWKAVFCLPGHVRPQHSSQANCPISGGLSRRRGTQRCLSRLDPPPPSATSRGEVKGWVGRSLPASQEGTGHFDVRWQTSILHLARPSIRGPILSENPASPRKTPPSSFTSGRLLWLYDYIWGFVWLCMYLHHSQLVPINNRARV